MLSCGNLFFASTERASHSTFAFSPRAVDVDRCQHFHLIFIARSRVVAGAEPPIELAVEEFKPGPRVVAARSFCCPRQAPSHPGLVRSPASLRRMVLDITFTRVGPATSSTFTPQSPSVLRWNWLRWCLAALVGGCATTRRQRDLARIVARGSEKATSGKDNGIPRPRPVASRSVCDRSPPERRRGRRTEWAAGNVRSQAFPRGLFRGADLGRRGAHRCSSGLPTPDPDHPATVPPLARARSSPARSILMATVKTAVPAGNPKRGHFLLKWTRSVAEGRCDMARAE